MNKKKILSRKDLEQREFILTENIWKVVLFICMPLVLYEGVNHSFRVFDNIIASYISSDAISTVAFLSQISLVISAFGGGLSAGASIKISEAYGAKEYELVEKRVSTIFAICGLMSLLVILLIPFTTPLLRLLKTPEEFISLGRNYFNISLINTGVIFFNNIYFGIERARGNSKNILKLNMIAVIIKLILTSFFVYVLNMGVTYVAIGSLVANLLIFLLGIRSIFKNKDIFSFSKEKVLFNKEILKPLFKISFPIIIERFSFYFGKVIVNSMSTSYGNFTVGALGISNNIGGITTAPQNGFQDGGASIISQNLGNKNVNRCLDTMKVVIIFNILIGIVGYILTTLFIQNISLLLSSNNLEFAGYITNIYKYEALAIIPLGISSGVMSLLYGFGYTKLTLFLSLGRIFLFRIPILFVLQNFTSVGYSSVGIAMMGSNTLLCVCSVVIGFFVTKNIRNNYCI